MKYIRNKPYVHIKFKPYNSKRAKWYWAIKLGPGKYKRVMPDGDTEISSRFLKTGEEVITEEILIGDPIEERIAHMNLYHVELEEE